MKFGLFFVMQRPEHLSERQVYESEIAQMVAADDLGYHSVWIAEHHFSDYGVCSAPQVLAAAVAGQTRRLRLGMGITLLPLHDPIQIAEELAVLDVLSGGRLEVGIGRASSAIEYTGFGVSFEESRARVDEGLDILRGAWTQERFSYQGRFRQIENARLVPKPLQKPYPPLYLACNSAETIPIAARHGLGMMTSFVVVDQAIAERSEVYRRVSAEYGHPSEAVEERIAQTWAIRFVFVTEDERADVKELREHLEQFLTAAHERPREVARPLDAPGSSFEDQVRAGVLYFGNPDQVTEQIRQFRERTGVQNLLCYTSIRGMDPVKVTRSMRLFAENVMPSFV